VHKLDCKNENDEGGRRNEKSGGEKYYKVI
jgi:hypothetical protein